MDETYDDGTLFEAEFGYAFCPSGQPPFGFNTPSNLVSPSMLPEQRRLGNMKRAQDAGVTYDPWSDACIRSMTA